MEVTPWRSHVTRRAGAIVLRASPVPETRPSDLTRCPVCPPAGIGLADFRQFVRARGALTPVTPRNVCSGGNQPSSNTRLPRGRAAGGVRGVLPRPPGRLGISPTFFLPLSLGRLNHLSQFFLGSAVNDPSAGSPTETLLRLLLPLNDQVRASSQWNRRGEPPRPPVRRPH